MPARGWVIHCDGSAIPNLGRMGLGATLAGPDGQSHHISHTSSLHGCNNEAELRALLAALELAHQVGARVIEVFSDSSILVEQLQPAPGRQAAAPIARLGALLDAARTQLRLFDNVQLHWVPRHRNRAADALARAALGAPPKPAPWPHGKKRKRKG